MGSLSAHGLTWRSCRGLRAGHAHGGVPQEPGRPSRLHGEVVLPREATERGGMGERESEYLIVPERQGNPPQGTLRREGGTELRSGWRERWREGRVP
jgi:hypothetical protein